MEEKLWAERNVIVRYALEQLKYFIISDKTFTKLDDEKKMLEEVARMANPIQHFVENCLEFDNEYYVHISDVYQAYNEFAASEALPDITRTTFRNLMANQAGVTIGKTKRRLGKNSPMVCFEGIRLKSMLLEEKAIDDLIDEAADAYKPIEDILHEHNTTLEEAVHEAHAFREKFFALLHSKEIPADNISRICREVAALTQREQDSGTVFLYTALLTENGLLFGELDSDEQAVLLWLEQKERTDYLTQRITSEPAYCCRLKELRHYKPQLNSMDIDRQEQAILYEMAIENTFLYQSLSKNEKKRNVFLQNLGELVRLVNANEMYRRVKPYIYFAVLSRKHKLMMEREHYSPNIPKIFDYQEYTIHRDNNKNFNTYQSYLELYGQLRESYEGEIDGALTDYCMANTSNLCQWFYENCEPDDVIPMSLSQVAEYLSNGIWLTSEDTDITGFTEANPVFEIACQNLLACTANWTDFVSAMQNGENVLPYAQRLYQKAAETVPCSDKEGVLAYTKCLLYHYMEEYNRQLLVNAAKHFMIIK